MNDRERLNRMVFNAWLDVATENDGVATAAQIADHLIALGVTVQKHGRWEFVDDYTGRCTYCHEENLMDWEHEDKYCPNCGAKMDLEEENAKT